VHPTLKGKTLIYPKHIFKNISAPNTFSSFRASSLPFLLPPETALHLLLRVLWLLAAWFLLCVLLQHCWRRGGGGLYLDFVRSSSVGAALLKFSISS